MPLSATSIGAAIARVCRREPVRLAYLFGSYAWGEPDEESDVDIAVLADAKLSHDARWALRLRLIGACAEALRVPSDKLDVVVLQDVPVLLRSNVILGIPVFQRSRSERVLFELRTEQEWDDERYYLERENAITRERILSQTS